jgi:hypothetical protein
MNDPTAKITFSSKTRNTRPNGKRVGATWNARARAELADEYTAGPAAAANEF